MDHKFELVGQNFTSCARCKYPPIAHGDQATCEACPNIGIVSIYQGMLLCKECKDKELEHQSPANQEKRLQESRERERVAHMNTAMAPVLSLDGVIDRARAIDQTIQVKSDIYNAQTVDNKTLKDAVWADETIPADQKYFKYATILRERQETFQKVIDDSQTLIIDNQNKQRVIQQELNLLSNQLRQEQRDKLHLDNPTYDPAKIKNIREAVTKPKSLGQQKQKFDKKELITVAAALQAEGFIAVNWSMLQMVATSKNMTVKQAAEHIKKTMGAK